MSSPSPLKTEVAIADIHHPDPAVIGRAADLLRAGELVAFPTETVYGLGANALDEGAVSRIFAAKGRPANNPIIVHVADADAARPLVAEWPDIADRLIERYWPGPLTLVFKKSALVPDLVTAGGATVAIRCPAHPVARALLLAARLPIAAPSANRSTGVSPTTAAHVQASLGGRIPLILDGGPCDRGIESTVLSLAVTPPLLLRPGPISARDLEAIAGPISIAAHADDTGAALPSPGRMPRHYAPHAAVEIVHAGDFDTRSAAIRADGDASNRVAHIVIGASPTSQPAPVDPLTIHLPADAPGYAAGLYAAMHRLDDLGATHILIDAPPDNEEWLAIRDRLRRAAHA